MQLAFEGHYNIAFKGLVSRPRLLSKNPSSTTTQMGETEQVTSALSLSLLISEMGEISPYSGPSFEE